MCGSRNPDGKWPLPGDCEAGCQIANIIGNDKKNDYHAGPNHEVDFIPQLAVNDADFDSIEEEPWYMIFTNVSYILNCIFIAGPWSVLGTALISWNLWLNIDFNRVWAGGNLWLIGNTTYLIV